MEDMCKVLTPSEENYCFLGGVMPRAPWHSVTLGTGRFSYGMFPSSTGSHLRLGDGGGEREREGERGGEGEEARTFRLSAAIIFPVY